ncbi:MAG: hypothetical protein RLZ44_95 [Pseudomonadota bacterium]
MTQLPEAVALLPEAEQADMAQYLTFVLADEHYGVDILRVQEIRGWEQVTRIPTAPDYVKGVINLRGAIVPIYDLRERFGMPRQAYTKETVVIVLHVANAQGERSLGVVVDAVSDVLTTTDAEVTATPEFGAHVPTQALRGLISDGDKMVMLIDVDVLTADES